MWDSSQNMVLIFQIVFSCLIYVCVCERPPLHIGVVAIEKGAFGLPSTMVDSTNDD